jgi:hypothetical protein
MKSTFFLAAATIIFSAAQAQDSTGTTGTMGTTTATDTTKKLNAYGSYSTRDSIAAKYKLQPMPAPLTVEKIYPVLGNYQLVTNTDATATVASDATTAAATATDATVAGSADATAMVPQVTVTLDSVNKGTVWIDGMPQGRMKAYLKKSPATYRILAQKTDKGTSVPEGTLIFDPATNVLNIALGTPFNDADPAGVFALSTGTTPEDNTAEVKVKTKNAKSKSKVEFYTANKVVVDQQQMQQNTQDFNNGLQQAQQNNDQQ